MGRRSGSDDRRDAELATHDRGMTRGAAVVGHDAGGTRHDRHPVGVGHLGHQDRAVDELLDVGRALDDARRSGGDRVADRRTGDEQVAAAGQPMHRELGRAASRLHGLGPGLHDEQLARDAVLGPLHVHRAPVVPFDGDRPTREGENILIAQYQARALGGGRLLDAGAHRSAGAEHHLGRLLTDGLLDDRRQGGVVEERLEDDVLVGVDDALHDRLAEAPRRADHHDIRKAAVGVDREHHAGAAGIRAHHALHADRERDIQLVDVVEVAVADRPVGEQ
jgi:hypothetical protein